MFLEIGSHLRRSEVQFVTGVFLPIFGGLTDLESSWKD
jgi:hypothetical protein